MAHRDQAFDRTAARRKCYEFLGEVFGAKAGFFGFNKMLLGLVVILDLKLRHVDIAHDDKEQVIEIMSDPTRQNPCRLEFLGVEQFRLDLFSIRFFHFALSRVNIEPHLAASLQTAIGQKPGRLPRCPIYIRKHRMI